MSKELNHKMILSSTIHKSVSKINIHTSRQNIYFPFSNDPVSIPYQKLLELQRFQQHSRDALKKSTIQPALKTSAELEVVSQLTAYLSHRRIERQSGRGGKHTT